MFYGSKKSQGENAAKLKSFQLTDVVLIRFVREQLQE